MLSPKFDEALQYATLIHAGQTRKGTGVPYLSHLLGVASIASFSKPRSPLGTSPSASTLASPPTTRRWSNNAWCRAVSMYSVCEKMAG